MKAYLAYLRCNLKLTSRDRAVLFFNYLFPLIFFLAFGEGFGASTSPGAMSQVLAMVLMIGVLGSGFFGAGLRAVAEREAGILRRFKVAPITPAPIVAAGLVTGWLLFMPTVAIFMALGHYRYHAPWPVAPISFFIIISLGSVAFRAIGLIIGSVVNSMAESQIIIQLLYLPNLMLSGATVPLSSMPTWLQTVAEFLPGKHLYLGLQSVLVRGESLDRNLQPLGAMVLTSVIGVFVAIQLFRWEKEEKLKGSAKLWVVGVMAPFLLIGAWQGYTKDNLRKTEVLAREMRRTQSWLIKDARVFVGDGTVVEQGSVLIRMGKIEKIFTGNAPLAKDLNAEPIEASGKTIMPGLIDTGVNLFLPGAGAPETRAEQLGKIMEREAAAHLFCGVTAIRTAPDPLQVAAALKKQLDSAEKIGAEIFFLNPKEMPESLVAARAAAGETEYLKHTLLQQVVRPPDQARLRELAAKLPRRQPAKLELAPGQPLATRSGQTLVPHGPMFQEELKLRVEAGESPADVLKASTSTAARLLGAGNRLGLIKPGYDATLLMVEGNPLEDISAMSRIVSVFFKGERVRRDDILNRNDKD